jgi:hypothetical protein
MVKSTEKEFVNIHAKFVVVPVARLKNIHS